MKKIKGWLVSLAVILGLTILALQAFLMWKNNEYSRTRLEIEHSGPLEENKRKQEAKENAEQAKLQMELDNLAGPNWADKGKVLDINKMDDPLGIKGLTTVGPGNLVYSKVIKDHFTAILEDIDDLVNTGQVYTHKDEEQDSDSSKFLRRNTILYGMAGTGKTEFPRQLAFEIAARYQSQNEKKINGYNEELLKKQEALIKDPENEQLKTEITELHDLIKDCEQQLTSEESKIIPVFQIDGFHLQGAGKVLSDKGLESHEKLIAIIKALKKEFFGDAFSDKPCIVFVEEADQGVNALTAGNKQGQPNLLEDWKNFLSTTEGSAGLKNNVQDKNSCLMIATNNYENLDPALVRRGRLGKKLNFSWAPELLKEYGEAGGQRMRDEQGNMKENWTRIDWPNDPSWDFTNSRYREELYKMSTKFGFAMFRKEFATHANKIINSWQNLEENKRKKKQDELGTFKDENDKETCNWLLHYLFTFHQYNSKQNLNAFNSAEQIQRYDFGTAARMEENTAAIASLISKAIINLNQGITGKLSEIRGEMVANFQELGNLKSQIENFRTNLTALDKDMESIRSDFTRLNDNIKSSIQLSSSQLTQHFSQQVSNLQSQISQLASRPIGVNSSGGGSSNSQLTTKYNNLNQATTNFTERLKSYLESGGKDLSQMQSIFNDFIRSWNNS